MSNEVPDHVAVDPGDFDRPMAAALRLLSAGGEERAHAAFHLADAIAADPSRPEPYEHLAGMVPTLAAFDELFAGQPSGYTGIIAGRAAIAAGAGDFQKGLVGIAGLSLFEPHKPWTRTTWWPDLITHLDPRTAAMSLASLASQLTPAVTGVEANIRGLAPYLQLARDLAARNPRDLELAIRLSDIANALGASDEAAAWRARAARPVPGAPVDMSFRFALSELPDAPEIERAWTAAIAAEPDRLDTYVELITALVARGRRSDGEAWLRRAAQRDPGHFGVRALRHALAYMDIRHLPELLAIVDELNEAPAAPLSEPVSYILAIACDMRPWLNRVPMPTEAAAALAHHIHTIRRDDPGATIRRTVGMTIEPPSVIAAVRRLGLKIDEIIAIVAPDPRVPIAEVGHRVWRYDGIAPVPAMPAPSPESAALLQRVANDAWLHPLAAYRGAADLGAVPLDELLGLLCHMPAAPSNDRWTRLDNHSVTYWPRLAAAWVCLGILHHRPDEPWPDSIRRRVLVDLVNGVEDWTVDSALFALIVAAWMDPAIRADVRTLVRDRLDIATRTQRQRLMPIAPSIGELMLITPGATQGDRAAGRRLIAMAGNPRPIGVSPLPWIKWLITRLRRG